MSNSIPDDPDERLNWYTTKMQEFYETFLEENPNWLAGTTLSILEMGIHSLKAYIDDVGNDEISWSQPTVELHFPVDIERVGKVKDEAFRIKYPQLTFEDIEDSNNAAKAISRKVLSHLETSVLDTHVMGAAVFEKADGYTPALLPEVIDTLEKLGDETLIERELRAYLQPRSFGAGTIRSDEDFELRDESTVSPEVLEQLGSIEPSLISLPITLEGYKLDVITIFEINPLVVDLENEQAYYPILVGLALQGNEDTKDYNWIDQSWASFSNWPNEDHVELWDGLKQMFELCFKELNYPAEDEPKMDEAIIEVHAKIRIRHSKGERKYNIEELIHALSQAGTVEAHRVQTHDAPKVLATEWKDLLTAVEEAKTAQSKGRSLEALACALFNSVLGFEIQNNVCTETEEIDLWISNSSSEPPFKNESPLILAECKNWNAKVGKNEIVTFREKLHNRSGRCKLGFLIAWGGFASTFDKDMLRNSREDFLVVPITQDQVVQAIDTGDFQSVIIKAYYEAMSH